jgi:Fe-S-cluster containining protein
MEYKQKFFDITNLIQHEFSRNVAMYGDKIKCSRGCSECCSQIFGITMLDGFIIKEHINSLPPARQYELKAKATEYIKREFSPSADYDPKKDSLPPLPCPALGSEGECTIYEARPVICRRFGMPIYDYKNPVKVHACHLNFNDGEEIIDDELIKNQTEIGMKWDELKTTYLDSLKTGTREYTTIAESIESA